MHSGHGMGRAGYSRSPHGERGLKFRRLVALAVPVVGRSPHGERGLKYIRIFDGPIDFGRSPHGERGLK